MTAAPRTLHLLARRTGGGTETNINRLCAEVPGFFADALETHLGFPFRWGRLPAALAALRANRPEVVFAYGAAAHAMAALAWPMGMPLVGNIRCESDFAGRKGLLRALLRPRFSGWVSNSRMALFGEPGIVIYNGIPEPAPEPPLLPDLPRPVFGLLANGHPKKGHRFFLDAWEAVGRPGSVAFGGRLPEDLRAEAQARGAHCPGTVPAGPFLRSLDLLVVPSDAEGLPTVLLEAMVRGVPCLATPVGGIPELIDHGRNGWMLPRPRWVDFLRSLDWEGARRLGAAGREHVRQRHGMEAMRAAFVEVARRAAERRPFLPFAVPDGTSD